MHGRQHANRAQQWQCAPAAAAAAPRAARLHSSRGKTLVPRAAADTAAPDELAATWKGFRCFKMVSERVAAAFLMPAAAGCSMNPNTY